MYTVKELIETLKQCPEDYQVVMTTEVNCFSIEQVGIDNEKQTVDLFSY